MKKSLFILLLVLMLTLVCSSALAEVVARVGADEFESFGLAVKAAVAGPNKTVTVVGTVPGYSFGSVNMTGVTIEGSATGKVTGMMNVTGSSTTFKDATIKDLLFEGGNIVFSTATNSFENFKITGCTFVGPGPASNSPAIQIQKRADVSVDGLEITNNNISGYGGAGILLNGGGGANCEVTIAGNTIKNVGSNAVQALNIEELSIENNTIENTGNVFNLYGTKNTEIAGNDVTLGENANYAVIYVSGKVDFAASNTMRNASGKDVKLSKDICHSETWNENCVVAVGGTTDTTGQYVSGRFIGSKEAVEKVVADGLKISGGKNNEFAVGMPGTGDEFQTVAFAAVLLLAAAAVVVLLRKRVF